MKRLWSITLALTVVAGASLPARATPPGRPGRLAFSRPVGDTSFQIFTMRRRGGDITQLTVSGYNREPQWSPDGRRIAWLCLEPDAPANDVCVMDADGTDRSVFEVSGNERSPIFDPTGRYLAYVGAAVGMVPVNEIFVRDLASGEVRRLTLNDLDEEALTWSPDGSTIAFIGDSDLYAVDVATGEERTILEDDMIMGDVDWSPNGRRLVYWKRIGERYASEDELFTIRADGSGERQVTKRAVMPVSTPVWSPAGGKVAFSYGEGDAHTCIFDPRRVLDLQDFPWDATCTKGDRFDLSWQPRPPA